MALTFTIDRICWAAILLSVLLLARAATAEVNTPQSAQPVQATEVNEGLELTDEEGVDHKISSGDFARLPRRSVKAQGHGPESEFEGVSLVDLLKSAGVKFGDALKGRRASTVAVLEATDNYRVAVALLEIDPQTTDRVALVADKRDGKPLDARLGPYRLVIPGDKREIRWIRNLRTIRVANLVDLPLRNAKSSPSNDAHP